LLVVIPAVIPLKETGLGLWTVPICLSIVSMMLLSVVVYVTGKEFDDAFRMGGCIVE